MLPIIWPSTERCDRERGICATPIRDMLTRISLSDWSLHNMAQITWSRRSIMMITHSLVLEYSFVSINFHPASGFLWTPDARYEFICHRLFETYAIASFYQRALAGFSAEGTLCLSFSSNGEACIAPVRAKMGLRL